MTESLSAEITAALNRHVTVPEGYRRARRLVGLSVPAETVLGGSYAVAIVFWLLGLGILVIGSSGVTVVVGAAALASSLGVALTGRYGVPLAAQARRIRALGAAPSVVVTLVLGMTLWPSAERAAEFAAAGGDGLLADSLEAHCRRADGTPCSGLAAFGTEWSDRFPALTQSVRDIERAAAGTTDEREALLQSARRSILDGTRDEMAAFAADLKSPATALYAFGVLLPLSFVALLPAVGAAGIRVTPALLVVTYGIFLPGVLAAASAWLLARRPIAFPPARVPRSHPDVPSGASRAILSGAFVAACTWTIAALVLPLWAPPVAALGGGLGTALAVHHYPVKQVRDHIDAVEDRLPEALSAVGRRIQRGESVESALDAAVDGTPEPLATVLSETVDRQATLGVDIESAFRGEYGTLGTLPSPRLRRAAVLLDAAAHIGPPAGETVVTMGDHLTELNEVERETRRDLAQVTGTLSNTAALFGPLVGGATVAMSATMGSAGPIESVSPAALGPVVGWYCLVLAAVLTALSTGLHSGLDRARVGYRVGVALCAATATYFAAVVGTGLLV